MAVGTGELKGTQDLRNKAHIAHGIIASLAVIVWFPLGVFLLRSLRLPNTVRYHAIWQCIGLLLLIVGFGLGSWLSNLQGGVCIQQHKQLPTVLTRASSSAKDT